MIKIPTENKIIQTNRSNILGNLWASFNLDLQSNLGVFRVSPRLQIQTSGVANQGRSVSFETFDQRIFTLSGTRIFKNSAYNLISPFVEDASTGAITTYSNITGDIKNFPSASVLVATADTKLMTKAVNGSGTGAWTERGAGLESGALHKLCYFKRQDRMYYFDSFTKIKSIDSSFSEAVTAPYSIDLTASSGVPYTMVADSNYIWIGTSNVVPSGTVDGMFGASVLAWDGNSSIISAEYKIKAGGVLAMCRDDSEIIHVIDSNGALLAFNAGGFTEIGRLPINRQLLTNSPATNYNGLIHPNGFYYTKNGTFIVLVNNLVGDSSASIIENLPSGIWEFHKDTGFVHRQSLSYTPIGTSTITDYGQNRISSAGALYEPNIYSESASGKPTLICGATYYTNASTTADAIFVNDPNNSVQKYGYFVSTWLMSQQIKETWNKVWAKFRQFLNSGDKIVVKYRTTEADPVYISITWLNTNSFVTSTDISAYIGYEVEILQGTGSGKCAHITEVNTGGGNYTAILDDTFTGVTTGTAKVRLQNWTKCGEITTQTSESEELGIEQKSMRIQIKVCLQFTGDDELFEIIVINKEDQLAV